ncbi:NADP-dependent oxidoreductase [Euzebya tangerina]|uniref:NADP-dependent oxidoreductase n=1 Tax=Euzebya tangerina TaxID=591198 RepID=UPI001474CFFE|nr:NADP-dependent oxidoreductase [Euzebya tangerina]
MHAMALTEYGEPAVLSLTELDDPTPAPDTVIIKTTAAGVNPVDWKIVAGFLQGAFPHYLPLVPGWDVSGEIIAVGPAVQEWAEGDEVIGYVRHDHVADNGSYAELVAAHPRHLARKPESVDAVTASALPLAGLTALQSLRLAGVGPDDVVLVHAAAGGVGSFAVQIAVHRGATVIGTASESNHAYLRDLGAIPVTYGDGLADRVRSAAPEGRITASVDYVGTTEAIQTARELITDPSRSVSNVDGQAITEAGGRYSFVRPQADDLLALSRLVDEGAVRIEVQDTYPLAEAAAALEASKGGHVRGKLALTVS